MLELEDFGKSLLDAGDLDPVYVLLWNAELDRETTKKWLLAYWAFYHVGTASWITEQADYWRAFGAAARSKEYPRSPERRHFRGENAIKATAYLAAVGVDDLFAEFERMDCESGEGGIPLADVLEYVQEWVGFGPWISFKVADMLERLNICRIRFDTAAVALFDSPADGARLARERYDAERIDGQPDGDWAIERILEVLGDTLAPPRYERRINAQEAETILCKWKSHAGGHYEVGEDIKACRAGLLRYPRCKLSQRLLKAGVVGGLW